MRIGYACITLGLPDFKLRTCRQSNATPDILTEIIESNLETLRRAVKYNADRRIELYRISSDLIPFGSSPVNQLDWSNQFRDTLDEIGALIKGSGQRVSMHPGQYTVINSPREEVVDRAIADLIYHTRLLDSLGTDASSKIIIHIGGIYGDKPAAIKRFIDNYRKLPSEVLRRLVIENDERLYTIEDCLAISDQVRVPVVFDNLHYEINRPETELSVSDWIARAGAAWGNADGNQKVHYSQQDPHKKPGAHTSTIDSALFQDFALKNLPAEIDVMLEVKDKDLSAVKCLNVMDSQGNIQNLEIQWARYKYSTLERSHTLYLRARALLKNKNSHPALEFYSIIDEALSLPANQKDALNGLQHVWGYLKTLATGAEKEKMLRLLKQVSENSSGHSAAKKHLHTLAKKYEVSYLLDSYYFVL